MDLSKKNETKQLNQPKGQSLRNWIAKMSDQIKCALPQNITPERMMRIALTAISKDEKLASSTPESFLGALLTSAQLGLECNTPLGQSYLIAFYNNKKNCLETQFQLGYQGLIDLCYRTNQYQTIQARIVYDGDIFEYEYGMNEQLIHKPMGKTANPIAVYAYYKLVNGAKAFEVMTWEQVEHHAKKYSQAVSKGYSSPWSTDPESMAKKTVLKKVLKYAPKTVEVAEAVNSDSAIITANAIQDGNTISVVKDFNFDIGEVETVESKPINAVEHAETKGIEQAFDNPATITEEENKMIEESFKESQLKFDGDVF